MINKEDLTLICNYHEDSSVNDSSSIYYLDYIDSSDDELMREIKTKNRQITIDAILDNKEEDLSKRIKVDSKVEQINTPFSISPGTQTTGVIGLQVFSTSISSFNKQKFTSLQNIWDGVIRFYDSLQNHSSLPTQLSSNLTLTTDPNLSIRDNIQTQQRRIITRIIGSSNAITTFGRVGPATFVIIGTDILKYFSNADFMVESSSKNPNVIGNIQGMSIIVSPLIKSNKIIVGRSESNKDAGGLMIFNNSIDYYMKPVKFSFNRNVISFEIT